VLNRAFRLLGIRPETGRSYPLSRFEVEVNIKLEDPENAHSVEKAGDDCG